MQWVVPECIYVKQFRGTIFYSEADPENTELTRMNHFRDVHTTYTRTYTVCTYVVFFLFKDKFLKKKKKPNRTVDRFTGRGRCARRREYFQTTFR